MRARSEYCGDPSEIEQLFPKSNLQLLCCHYWWLSNWEFENHAYPFWRLYYNVDIGAKLIFNGIEFEMEQDKLYLIAPNTAYASRLFNNTIPKGNYNLKGDSLLNDKTIDNCVRHLFIHFNIGFPYDNVTPNIYIIPLNEYYTKKINIIKTKLVTNITHFNFQAYMTIQSLIIDVLSDIDKEYWENTTKDTRIKYTVNYIENNLKEELSNDNLAENICMTANGFSRLFKQETGFSPQQFIRHTRISKSCSLLLHSNMSIDEIAELVGFANRYYFTRVFNEIMNQTPKSFKKN